MSFVLRWRSIGICLATVGLPQYGMADTYTCQSLDIPNNTNTQVWQLNDRNQVAASSDTGGSIYDPATGQWTALLALPADTGHSAFQSALGINNRNQVVGDAYTDVFAEEGFILSAPPPSGTYTLEPLLQVPAYPTYTS